MKLFEYIGIFLCILLFIISVMIAMGGAEVRIENEQTRQKVAAERGW